MKLPNNTGSITKLSGNRRKPYMIRITTGWKYNREKDKMEQERTILGYARTKKEALEILIEYNKSPFDIEESKTTFYEVFERWYKDYQNKNVSSSSLRAYECSIKDLKPLWNKPIKNLKTIDLQRVIDQCGKNYPTLKKIKLCIKQIYKYAMEYDIISKDYSSFVDLSKYKDKNPNALNRTIFSPQELKKLWDYKDDPYTQVLLIYIYTGVRASELLELKKKDIDLENHVFQVTKSKTENGIRTVPIADKIYPFIERLYHLNDSEFLLTTPGGGPLEYRNYRDSYFKPLMTRYRMDHHIHDTRHTCISLLTLANVKQVTIKKIVGHRGAMSLTEKVYTHLDYKELLDAINSI